MSARGSSHGAKTHVGGLEGSLEDCYSVILSCNIFEALGPTTLD